MTVQEAQGGPANLAVGRSDLPRIAHSVLSCGLIPQFAADNVYGDKVKMIDEPDLMLTRIGRGDFGGAGAISVGKTRS